MAQCTITIDTSVRPFTLQYIPGKKVHRGDTVAFLLAPGCTAPATVSFATPSCFDDPPPTVDVTSTTEAVPSPPLTVSNSAVYDTPYYFDVSPSTSAGTEGGLGATRGEVDAMRGELDVVPPSPPEKD